jgi:hypothetical protein
MMPIMPRQGHSVFHLFGMNVENRPDFVIRREIVRLLLRRDFFNGAVPAARDHTTNSKLKKGIFCPGQGVAIFPA